jgi:hypothetical protein
MWKWFLLLAMYSLLLAGCVQGDLHVTINKDGSGIYQWKVLTNAYAQRYLQNIVTIYSTKGYEAKLIREKGKAGFIATKPVKNIAKEPLNKELSAAIPSTWFSSPTQPAITSTNSTSNNPIKELTINSGFLQTSFFYQTEVNMKKTVDHLAGPYSSYVNNILDQLKMRFLLTLPIAPTKNNASAVSKDGKTLTWNLKLGQKNPILLGTDIPTPIVLVLAAASNLTKYVPHFWTLTISWILLIILVIAIFILFFKWMFRRKK